MWIRIVVFLFNGTPTLFVCEFLCSIIHIWPGCGSKPMVPFWGVGAPPISEPILVGIGMFTTFGPKAKR